MVLLLMWGVKQPQQGEVLDLRKEELMSNAHSYRSILDRLQLWLPVLRQTLDADQASSFECDLKAFARVIEETSAGPDRDAQDVLDAALVVMDSARPQTEVRKDYIRLREAVAKYRDSRAATDLIEGKS